MRMKDKIWIYSIIATFFGLLASCEKEEFKTVKQEISGHVQKGPYIVGTSISMSELKPSLDQTGKAFTSQISNNSGFFEFTDVSLTSKYVEFSANGFYYDEVKGSISQAPLSLYSISDITSIATVNVNILTHLEKLRVEFLIKQNKSFSEAKKIAQSEVLAIFGIESGKMNSSELLDISNDNEGNAILLAISVIVQGNRTVGDLTELLANISNDIREDGILNSASTLNNLRNSAKSLTLATIRSNLERRYQDLEINATIPNFENYVGVFLTFVGEKPTASTQAATGIATASVTLNAIVNANSLNTSISFEYGTTTSYGETISATQSVVAGFSDVNVSAGLNGIMPGLTYHFRVKAGEF